MIKFMGGASMALIGAAFMCIAIAAIEYSERLAPALQHAAQSLAFALTSRR